MKDDQKKAISRKLIRLALEMRETANMLRWEGLTEKAIEIDRSATMCKEWAEEIVR
jgi:hypothetical protein